MDVKLIAFLAGLSFLWVVITLYMYSTGVPVLWMFPCCFAEMGTFLVWWAIVSKRLSFEDSIFVETWEDGISKVKTQKMHAVKADQWLVL